MLLYDGEGCLFAHALFLERGGAIAPAVFGEIFRTALDRASVEFPPGPLDARAQARVANARNVAAFRVSEGRGAVIGGSAGRYPRVARRAAERAPLLSSARRCESIAWTDRPTRWPTFARTACRSRRSPWPEIATTSMRWRSRPGASRIARFGELQRPPLGGNHGARPRIAEFVRWVTSEA